MTLYLAEDIRELSLPQKFGGEWFLTKGRLESLQAMIAAGLTGEMANTWDAILTVSNSAPAVGPLDPFDTPPFYDDGEGAESAIAIIRADLERAVDLAIRWKVLGDPADAAAVVTILTPWTTIGTFNVTNNERLNWANKWTLALQAAMLIRDSAAYTGPFDTAMKAVSLSTLNLYQPAFTMTDNRNMWGVAYQMAVGAFNGDRAIFDSAVWAWRDSMNTSLVNNILVHEVRREGSTQGNGTTGLYYSNFYLAAAVTAAEIARFNGEWLYDYITPDGSTLRGCWERVAFWTANPARFPYNSSGRPSTTVRILNHVDPLHALWPNESSQYLIDTYAYTQDYRGLRAGVLAYRDRPLIG